MSIKLLFEVLKEEILSSKSLLFVILLSLIFVIASITIINIQSFISLFSNNYSIFSKLYIFLVILLGTFSATSKIDIILVIIMGVLFGINMTLIINKFSALKKRGNLRLMAGTGIISVFAAGCASCGLSFASLIGISAVLAILPFGGVEIYMLAIGILLLSIYFNVKQIIKVCKIN